MKVPPPFRSEGYAFPQAVPTTFERFYRQSLRRQVGARIRTTAVRDAFAGWAAVEGEAGASFNQLAEWMAAIGHRKVKSNGMFFADAVFACDAPQLPDNFRLVGAAEQLGVVTTRQLVAALDAIEADVRRIRLSLAAFGDRG